MPDLRAKFLAAMRAQPDDLVTPLVFADWLDEHGDADRAAFIRAHCRGEDVVRERKAALCRRLGVPAGYDFAVEVGYSRGFLDSLTIPVQWIVEGADALADEPLLRKLTVGRVNGWGGRLAALPLLANVRDLEVEAWISPADARALAASPHLRQLRALEVWLGNVDGGDDLTLNEFARGVVLNYTGLEELRLVGVPGVDAETVAVANMLAAKRIARAVIPLPRLHPIAATIGDGLHAGRLPDGTQVLAVEEGLTARLVCFTAQGEQTEIRRLYLTGEGADDFETSLRREVGFLPALIRVLGIDDPAGNYRIDPDSGATDDDYGVADNPAVRPEDEPGSDDAMGRASHCAYWLKYGAYVLRAGNAWYVGPDGEVEIDLTRPYHVGMNVSLLVTCLGDVLFPNVGVATVRLLRRLGVNVAFPPAQTCCGQPHFNSGYHDEARALAKHTLQAFAGPDRVVVPSGSCAAMVKLEFPHLLKDEPEWHARALDLASRTHELSDFLVNVLGRDDVGARFPGRVTYHMSCHLRGLSLFDEPLRLLKKVRDLTLVDLERADECCGFGGSFAVRYQEISGAMVRDKCRFIRDAAADAVVATDAGCLMNIGGCLRREANPVRTLHLAEVLEAT